MTVCLSTINVVFCSGMRRNQSLISFAFPFSSFLIFLLEWLTYWACLLFTNFRESVIETGNFCHVVATCSGRKFCSEFFTQIFWAFSCIFQASLGRSLRSGYHWKDLFLLQKLSINDTNFGQGWWRQKWNKRIREPALKFNGIERDVRAQGGMVKEAWRKTCFAFERCESGRRFSYLGLQGSLFRQCPHNAQGIWKRRFISTVIGLSTVQCT